MCNQASSNGQSFPQAVRATGRQIRGGDLHPSNKLVAESLDAALERSIVLRVPLRAILTRHDILAREGNVQDIVLIVTGIAVDRSSVASRRKCDGGLTNEWLTIVSIGVSPHTIHLVGC